MANMPMLGSHESDNYSTTKVYCSSSASWNHEALPLTTIPIMSKLKFTTTEAASILNVSHVTVWRWVKSDKVAAIENRHE